MERLLSDQQLFGSESAPLPLVHSDRHTETLAETLDLFGEIGQTLVDLAASLGEVRLRSAMNAIEMRHLDRVLAARAAAAPVPDRLDQIVR
jgi:hypothetical protein